ncbi:Tryptophan--tRNA ligase [Dirofilaria immitis]
MLQLVVILIHISNPILAKQADDSVHHLGITKSLSNILHSMYGDVKQILSIVTHKSSVEDLQKQMTN